MTTKKVNRRAVRRKAARKRPLHKKILLHPISIFGLLCCGVLLTGITWQSLALSYTVTAIVPATALSQPAVIVDPSNNSIVTRAPITITGTCPPASYVALNRNGLFSGVSLCNNGQFSITSDLFSGQNKLYAQDYNLTDQAGPPSQPFYVTYNAPSLVEPSINLPNSSSNNIYYSVPLALDAAYEYQVFRPNNQFQWTVNLNGGIPPYLAKISWGDSSSTIETIKNSGNFVINHKYTSSGNKIILINVTDSRDQATMIQLVAVIKPVDSPNGVVADTGQSVTTTPASNIVQQWLWLAWPVYLIIALMTASFWLGESQEYFSIFKQKKITAKHR